MTGKKKDPTARELAERVVQRQKLVEEILRSQFQLSGFGTTFKMGEDITPNMNHVRYVLKQLWVMDYALMYGLLPDGVPVEKLGTAMNAKIIAWLVPEIVQAVERKTMAGQINILDTKNRSLIYIMDILGWYWYHSLGGPKPDVNQMVKARPQRLIQNETLTCPLCYHRFAPSLKAKTQEAKMWEYVEWLPTHCVEYHRYSPPARIKSWVKKSVLQGLEKFLLEVKSHPELYKSWFHK